MSFTGKATYSAGATLPEIAEDVSDIIGIVSPYETALLDRLGDPPRAASSTYHEWLEDELLPNTDVIDDASWGDPATDTTFDVENGERFRIGDQIQSDGSKELMLVTGVATNALTVVRGYGGTSAEDLGDDQVLHILNGRNPPILVDDFEDTDNLATDVGDLLHIRTTNGLHRLLNSRDNVLFFKGYKPTVSLTNKFQHSILPQAK